MTTWTRQVYRSHVGNLRKTVRMESSSTQAKYAANSRGMESAEALWGGAEFLKRGQLLKINTRFKQCTYFPLLSARATPPRSGCHHHYPVVTLMVLFFNSQIVSALMHSKPGLLKERGCCNLRQHFLLEGIYMIADSARTIKLTW